MGLAMLYHLIYNPNTKEFRQVAELDDLYFEEGWRHVSYLKNRFVNQHEIEAKAEEVFLHRQEFNCPI